MDRVSSDESSSADSQEPLPARHPPDGNIDSLVVTGDGRPTTQAYLSAGNAYYQSYQNGGSSPPGSPQQPIAIALRGRKTGMEDPSRNRPSGELARTPGLPGPSAIRQEPTAKSSPTVIDLDAVKLFLHKRMTEMEVVSHSTQTAKVLLEATDVLPYEKMKLRLLNASHQALCYIGMLHGYRLVHETMADRDIQTLVEKMMDHEVTPLLSEVPGVDLTEYKKTLIERFANPAIRDQLSRIGIYGSSGIPKFVLPSIEEQLQRRGPIKLLSFTVASWFRFLDGLDESGKEMPMLDPLAPTLRQRAKAAGRDSQQLLAMREIFSEELANSPAFVKEINDTLQSFLRKREPGRHL
jgi:hypothetical protein